MVNIDDLKSPKLHFLSDSLRIGEVQQIGVSVSSQTDIKGVSDLLSWSHDVCVCDVSNEDAVDLPVITPSNVPLQFSEVIKFQIH